MLYESPYLRVSTEDGIATVWLAFPGPPVNGLSPTRVRELGKALDVVCRSPQLDAVVLRSELPTGFCGGFAVGATAELLSEDDATAFTLAGQRVSAVLAGCEPVTVAYIDGQCLGPGLELALACDYRLAVAGPDSWFGFPDAAGGLPPCWGGIQHVRQLVPSAVAADLLAGRAFLTAREAVRVGLIDDAFSARRGNVELRTWLDRIQANPRKPARSATESRESLTSERIAFRAAVRAVAPGARPTARPVCGSPATPAEAAVEAALRGTETALPAEAAVEVDRHLAEAVRRGRVTPLEASQARQRIGFVAAATVGSRRRMPVPRDPVGV